MPFMNTAWGFYSESFYIIPLQGWVHTLACSAKKYISEHAHVKNTSRTKVVDMFFTYLKITECLFKKFKRWTDGLERWLSRKAKSEPLILMEKVKQVWGPITGSQKQRNQGFPFQLTQLIGELQVQQKPVSQKNKVESSVERPSMSASSLDTCLQTHAHTCLREHASHNLSEQRQWPGAPGILTLLQTVSAEKQERAF